MKRALLKPHISIEWKESGENVTKDFLDTFAQVISKRCTPRPRPTPRKLKLPPGNSNNIDNPEPDTKSKLETSDKFPDISPKDQQSTSTDPSTTTTITDQEKGAVNSAKASRSSKNSKKSNYDSTKIVGDSGDSGKNNFDVGFLSVGLSQVLRDLQRGCLSAAFLDADILRSSAFSMFLGTTFTCHKVPVYSIHGMSSVSSRVLGIRSASAIGILKSDDFDSIKLISKAAELLKPASANLASDKYVPAITVVPGTSKSTTSMGQKQKNKKKRKIGQQKNS